MIEVFRNPHFLTNKNCSYDELIHVANVNTEDLNVAYELTNSIYCHWSNNELDWIHSEVKNNIDVSRSTSVGDYMHTDDGWYLVDSVGFTRLEGWGN